MVTYFNGVSDDSRGKVAAMVLNGDVRDGASGRCCIGTFGEGRSDMKSDCRPLTRGDDGACVALNTWLSAMIPLADSRSDARGFRETRGEPVEIVPTSCCFVAVTG